VEVVEAAHPGLEKDHRLQAWNLKPFSAPLVLADEHVVHANQMIAGFLKLRPIFIGRVGWKRSLLCPANPADLILAPHATLRAGKHGRLDLLAFSVKISFVHGDNYSRIRREIPMEMMVREQIACYRRSIGV
jgi:hypothetical protein